MRTLISALLLLAALAWIAFVAREAMAGWPRVSLDMAPNDSGTGVLLRNAQLWHVLRHALIALVPAVVVMLIAGRIRGGGGARQSADGQE